MPGSNLCIMVILINVLVSKSIGLIENRKFASFPNSSISNFIKETQARSPAQCLVDCFTVTAGCRSASYNKLDRKCRLHDVSPQESVNQTIFLEGYSLYFETGCDAGWITSLRINKCYYYSNDSLGWAAAQALCEFYEGSLVIINDLTEFGFITANNNGKGYVKVWVGARWNAGANEFQWVDGSSMMNEGWTPNSPSSNDGCVSSNKFSGWQWDNKGKCTDQNGYICEKYVSPKN